VRYSTFQVIRSYTLLLKEKLYFCLICNTHFVWHRKKSTKLLFNPCSVKQPVMHIWTRRGFYDYLTTGGSCPSRWRRLRAQTTNGLYFHVATVKNGTHIWNISIFPFYCRHLCHSKPQFPWAMTSNYWSHSYKTLLLHPILLAYAIHMAGREQKLHCSRLMLLFEAASKRMSVDLEYNVEATHLTSFPSRKE